MVLNEELTWADVGAIETDSAAKTTVADAFQLAFGEPSKDKLGAGMSLYKFNNYPSISANDPPPADHEMTPWWTATKPYKHDGGLEQKLKIAEANGVSAREWGRLTSVIKEEWSSLAYILTIQLEVPVYAWFGGFKGMNRTDAPADKSKRDKAVEASGSTKLPGGGTQFYIPNLTFGCIKTFSIKPI
ncbi:MAG: hypothetical protein AAFY59_18085 [Pseudomonadota bacterium]